MTGKRVKDINNCHKKHEDRINLTVPKGQKAELQDHAERRGESLNAFIRRAIQETIERDTEVDLIEENARKNEISIEEEQKIVMVEKAICTLETEYPEIRELHYSGKLHKYLAHIASLCPIPYHR